MEKSIPFKDVLVVFAHYGFRKASMGDLARAAGVSRQTLYNRFRTKDAVLDWAVEGFVREALERASAELANGDEAPADCLVNAFARRTGDHVALLHDSPHGAEIMDMGIASLRRADEDPEAGFDRVVVRFLRDRGMCKTQKEATDKAYLLYMSSKGLFLASRSPDAFRKGMSRIVAAAFHGVGPVRGRAAARRSRA